MPEEKTPVGSEPPKAPPPPPPKKRGWLFKVGLGLGIFMVVVILLIAFVAPPIAASVATGKIKEIFKKQLNGEIDIGSLSVSIFGGTAHLSNVKITPTGGETLLTLPQASAKVGVLGAIGGHYDVQVKASDALVNIVRETSGKTNLDLLLAAPPQQAPESKPAESGKSEPMDMKLNIQITGTRLVFKDKITGKETEIKNLDVKADLPSMKKDADVKISFDVAGGGKAQVDAKINPDTMAGTVDYTIDLNTLKALEGAVGMFADINKLEGQAMVKGNYTIIKFPAVKGTQSLVLKGLALGGPLVGPEPIKIPEVSVTQTVSIDEQGTGTAKISMVSGKALDLQIDANLKNVMAPGAGSIDGKLVITSDLQSLTDQMPSLLKMKEGYRLKGALTGRSNFDAKVKDKNLESATFDLNASGNQLIVVYPGGAEKPMNTELVVKTQGAYNKAAGTFDMPSLVATFGELQIDGKIAATGLSPGGAMALKDTTVDVRADLGKVMERLKDFMDLKQGAEGTITLKLIAAGQGRANQITISGDLKAVKVTGVGDGVSVGPINGTLSGKILKDENLTTFDNVVLQSNVIATSIKGTMTAAGVMDLSIASQALPDQINQTAGGLLGSMQISGKPVDVWVKLKGVAEDMTASVTTSVPELKILRAPTADHPKPEPLVFQKLDVKTTLTRKGEEVAYTLSGPGVTGKGSGRLQTDPDFYVKLSNVFTIVPAEFSQFASGLLGGMTIEGDVVNVKVDWERGKQSRIKGMLNGKSFTAKGGSLKGPVTQSNFEAKFDVTQDTVGSGLRFDEATYKSDTATGDIQGTIVNQDMNLTMNFTSDLASIQRDLWGVLGLPADLTLKGALVSSGEVKTVQGVTHITEKTSIKNFHMSGPKITPVDEAEIKMDAVATMQAAKRIIDFQNGSLTSSFLRGSLKGRVLNYDSEMELQGMEIDFVYIPDKLNSVLSPWLGSMKLVGDKERRITGKLDGKAKDGGVMALLRGSNGKFEGSLGQVVAEGFSMDATVQSQVHNETIVVNGPAEINGGKMNLTGTINLADPKTKPKSQFGLTADNVNLNAQNGNLLAMLSGTTGKAAKIEGLMNSNLQGSYTGDLADLPYLSKPAAELTTPEMVAAQQRARQGFNMAGSINVDKFLIQGSPFIVQLITSMDVGDGTVPGYLKIPDLNVANGVTSFQQMEMRVQNTVIRMWGTINFDKTLHLTMKAPLDAKMLKGIGMGKEEREMIGKYIDIPIRGTTDKPDVRFGDALGQIAADWAKKKLEKEVQKGIEDLLKPKKRK